MDSEALDRYLGVLRRHGTMSAELKLPNGGELRVVFGPELTAPGLPVTEDIAPGAWKKWAGEGDK
jgi:hypothetical protein